MGLSEGLPKDSVYPDEMGRAAFSGPCVDLSRIIAKKVSLGGQIVGECSLMMKALEALGEDRWTTSALRGGALEDREIWDKGAATRGSVTAYVLGSYRF